ncbi:MAG: hypothetical protein HY690_20305 [Chloroflexi bacterium]|nr:hypothetical protein [Chloroflexota bacterium]
MAHEQRAERGWSLGWLNADGRKLLLTRALRTFGYGYLAVVLALYLLEALGLSPAQVGVVLTAAIAGSALMTVFWRPPPGWPCSASWPA